MSKENLTLLKNMILNLFKKFLYSFILASVLFNIILPEVKIFLLIFDAIWLLLLIGYGKEQNRELLCNIICLTLGVLSSYIIIKFIKHGSLKNLDVFSIFALILGALEILAAIALIAFGNDKSEQEDKSNIFPARQYDLERIREFVLKVPIVGVNASWGNGKTFVIEHLCRELEKEYNYEMVWIDLLTCNLDEIELILTSELEKILTAHHIYSRNSRQLKAMLNNNFLNQVQDYVMDSSLAISSVFSELKHDLEKINTEILIVYDDLDRLLDKKNIQKIFAISEKLSGGNIHILYQYDSNNLKSIGLERGYLEKYIPFTVNLTDMGYEDIVKELWDELEMDKSGITQKEILYIPTILPANPEVEKILTPNAEINYQLPGVSIRSVRIYLEEAKLMLNQNEYFSKDEVRGTVLRFLFLKNFWNSYYEEFRVWKDVEETLLFEYDKREYTMSDILSMIADGELTQEKIEEVFKIKRNKEVYFLLRMLDCEFIWKKKDEKVDNRQYNISKNITELNKREKKDRINHIIWNVLANGKSEYTDMRAAIDKFKKEVLDAKEDEWEETWNKYCNDMFHNMLKKGNHTIFKIGVGYFISLFQGFCIIGATSDEWQRLLEFYDKIEKDKNISLDLVKCLSYCDIHLKPVYLKAMHLFCSREIAGQLNDEESYWKFLQVYFRQIFYFGYSQNSIFEPWNFEWKDLTNEIKKIIKDHMPQMIETLRSEKDESPISPMKEEYNQIMEFIRKNMELMETKVRLKNNPIIHMIEERTIWPHQDCYNRLLQYKHDDMTVEEKKAFISEIEESYLSEGLYPIEVRALMKELDY